MESGKFHDFPKNPEKVRLFFGPLLFRQYSGLQISCLVVRGDGCFRSNRKTCTNSIYSITLRAQVYQLASWTSARFFLAVG